MKRKNIKIEDYKVHRAITISEYKQLLQNE